MEKRAMNEVLIRELFGTTGGFAGILTGYVPREQQIQMAVAVDSAINASRHIIVEGPCGVGKTLAYLVPAVLYTRAGRKVLVATASITLQDQLEFKDLPLVQQAMLAQGKHFTYTTLKGRTNYLCELNCRIMKNQLGFYLRQATTEEDKAEAKQIEDICEWANKTKTGDKRELPFVPLPGVWPMFSMDSDDCSGRKCGYYSSCWVYKARDRAEKANIVVVNYHLLMADIALKLATDGEGFLPTYELLIADEAHQLADVAREFIGEQIGYNAIHRIVNKLNQGENDESVKPPILVKRISGDQLKAQGRIFFDNLTSYFYSGKYKIRLYEPIKSLVPYAGLCNSLNTAEDELNWRSENIHIEEADRAIYKKYAARAKAIREAILNICDTEQPTKYAYWIEGYTGKTAKGHKLCRKPIYVADTLNDNIFSQVLTVLTSATLIADGSFAFIKGEAGLYDTVEVEIDSPFNFQQQAELIISDNTGPDPYDREDFANQVAEVASEIVKIVDKNILFLFTSYKVLSAVKDTLRGMNLPSKILVQGEVPNTVLMKEMREGGCILLGTSSFWEGIDVVGEALSLLVIDKLPFPNPVDPLVDTLNSLDKKSFFTYCVPKAVIDFKQGFGRLIRSTDDYGVIIVLDHRLGTKSYGKSFLNSLPSAPIIRWRKRDESLITLRDRLKK
jgi:ATP-dependent DNA helicase DinG